MSEIRKIKFTKKDLKEIFGDGEYKTIILDINPSISWMDTIRESQKKLLDHGINISQMSLEHGDLFAKYLKEKLSFEGVGVYGNDLIDEDKEDEEEDEEELEEEEEKEDMTNEMMLEHYWHETEANRLDTSTAMQETRISKLMEMYRDKGIKKSRNECREEVLNRMKGLMPPESINTIRTDNVEDFVKVKDRQLDAEYKVQIHDFVNDTNDLIIEDFVSDTILSSDKRKEIEYGMNFLDMFVELKANYNIGDNLTTDFVVKMPDGIPNNITKSDYLESYTNLELVEHLKNLEKVKSTIETTYSRLPDVRFLQDKKVDFENRGTPIIRDIREKLKGLKPSKEETSDFYESLVERKMVMDSSDDHLGNIIKYMENKYFKGLTMDLKSKESEYEFIGYNNKGEAMYKDKAGNPFVEREVSE